MLTSEDITKIVEANTEIFATKGDLAEFREEMRKNFSDLQIAVDAYARKADAYFQEMIVLAHKVNRLEKWVHQIAEKVDIKLGY
jgi:uncharacterized coiled-coil DUF342 family protein